MSNRSTPPLQYYGLLHGLEITGRGLGEGGKKVSVQEFFLSPTHLQKFFSRLHEYFFKAQPLAEIFLYKVPLQDFFGKSHPPPPSPPPSGYF